MPRISETEERASSPRKGGVSGSDGWSEARPCPRSMISRSGSSARLLTRRSVRDDTLDTASLDVCSDRNPLSLLSDPAPTRDPFPSLTSEVTPELVDETDIV